MAKRATSRRGKATTARKRNTSQKGLDKLRAEIDRTDRELLKLLNQRARLCQEVGRVKAAGGVELYSPTREKHIIDNILPQNRGPLPDRCVRAVFRQIVSGTRTLMAPLRIAYLGPAYSYSHLAAMEQFGQSAELVPVATIAAVFEEVNHRQSDFGLVPLENSTDGRVADTLEMFVRMPARVCSEVPLRIHHNLLGRCPRDEVREVYSKPQAISQCRKWLAQHMPAARTMEIASTTKAAELAAEKPATAAIASLQAAARYELDVIAPNIEDNPDNITRFAVIGQQSSQPTGKDKTALMFQVAHRPGALAEALNIFKRHKLNMTWIESFPVPGAANEYLFFVELEGHEEDEILAATITALDAKCVRLTVLGSYAKAQPID